jgi:hypothetical protein
MMGQTTRDILAGSLLGVTGGASLLLARDDGNDNDKADTAPREIQPDPEKKPGVLKPARSRKDRLAEARKRSNFRTHRVSTGLGTTEDKPKTRSGISLGGGRP